VRKNLICSSDATKLVERVEFYCNGKELRAASRQNPRICARAACSMRCAYISHTFLARNHLLAFLLLSAGRRDAAVRVSCLRAEKNARCFAVYTAPPFYCRIAVAQGVAAAAGPQFRSTMGSICMIGLWVHYTVRLLVFICDLSPSPTHKQQAPGWI
jgi:hypothetical protein